MPRRRTPSPWILAGLAFFGVMTLATPTDAAHPRSSSSWTLVEGPPNSAIPGDLLGQSWGRPDAGRLVRAVPFPRAVGYHLRRVERAFATASTVRVLADVLRQVHELNPTLHPLAVGDLSAPEGGPLPGHRSHQSGRDVDLGFFYRNPPPAYPRHFVRPRRGNLHEKAMWDLLVALSESSQRPGGVQYVMLDYELQAVLHAWAVRNDVDRAELEEVLQYPRGRRSKAGIVRHFPGHENHMHVRFGCGPTDFVCFDGRLR